MNKFALGLITAIMFTTPEGKEVTEKATKMGVRLGDKYLKSKYNIDLKAMLSEGEEKTEPIKTEPKKVEKVNKQNFPTKSNGKGDN